MGRSFFFTSTFFYNLPMPQFKSNVADMKNMAATTGAGASCAGHFIESHLGSFTGIWVHLDMSKPSKMNKLHDGCGFMGTGYGVALLSDLFSECLSKTL